MASIYVYSGATGTGDGSSWANAYTTLVAALARTGAAAGDRYYIAHDHLETSAAALTVNSNGALGSPDLFLCVSRAGSVPPAAADLIDASGGVNGAVFRTTGNVAVNFNGFYYGRGLHLQSGSGATGTANITVGAGPNGTYNMLERCCLEIAATGSSSRMTLGNGNSETHLLNCSTKTIGSFQGIVVGNNLYWHNDAGVPTSLAGSGTFDATANGRYCEFYGLDLSGFTSLFNGSGGNAWIPICHMENCKLGSTDTVAPQALGFWDIVACDVGGDIAHNERWDQLGHFTTDETVKRTGGMAINGTGLSWKLGSTAQCAETQYFETFEVQLECLTVGSSKTLTLHTLIDNASQALLDNSQIWAHVEYLGTSGSTISSIASSRRATILDTAVAYTTESTSSWTTTGLTTPVAQKIVVTFTPQQAGLVRVVVRVGAPSLNAWLDPQPDLV